MTTKTLDRLGTCHWGVVADSDTADVELNVTDIRVRASSMQDIGLLQAGRA